MTVKETEGVRRRTSAVLAVVTVLAFVLAGALGWLYLHSGDDSDGYVSKDLDGNRVQWGTPPDVAGSDAQPTGRRFRMPGQGLDVPLQEASVTGAVVNPPDLTDAFLLRDYGDPKDPSSGLSVVAFHAVRDGRGPGNYLFDFADPADPVLVHPGDPIRVGGQRYRVTDTTVESKRAAAGDPRIWGDQTDRGDELVVLTCLLRPGVPLEQQDNLVVFAKRIG